MERHFTHQIDDLAQRVLKNAVPPTWVLNRQENDYAKDYLVEIGDKNGELTGMSFFLQLKGHNRAKISKDKRLVKQSLESKYAKYYHDKIKDLPVFLVVVDVTRKKGWWIFLQPLLASNPKWLRQKRFTVDVPRANEISNIKKLKQAILEAKKWMRLHHPSSIHEAVIAHKSQIMETDPRFDVISSLENDRPFFRLLPKRGTDPKFKFTFTGKNIGKKLKNLFDRGKSVRFEPGELKVDGTRLFERIEQFGGSMQASVQLECTVTFVCRDKTGTEISRLEGVSGRITGGRKELFIRAELRNSPFTVELGPIKKGLGGTAKVNLSFKRWNGQRLGQLAYFDRLDRFFASLGNAKTTLIECESNGNHIFSTEVKLREEEFAGAAVSVFESVSKARNIAKRFGRDPVWQAERFDLHAVEEIEKLYAIFFEGRWTQAVPGARLLANCLRKTLDFEWLTKNKGTEMMRVTSEMEFDFFGEKLSVGRLACDYTNMTARIVDDGNIDPPPKVNGKKKYKSEGKTAETVKVEFIGSKETVLTIQAEAQVDAAQPESQLSQPEPEQQTRKAKSSFESKSVPPKKNARSGRTFSTKG